METTTDVCLIISLALSLPSVTKTEFLITILIQYQGDKWWEYTKISIRWLQVDLTPNSPKEHQKNCITDRRKNFWWDLKTRRVMAKSLPSRKIHLRVSLSAHIMHNLIYITCLQTSNNRIQKLRHLSITDHNYFFSFVANPLFYFRGVYLEFSLPLPLTNETFNSISQTKKLYTKVKDLD